MPCAARRMAGWLAGCLWLVCCFCLVCVGVFGKGAMRCRVSVSGSVDHHMSHRNTTAAACL